MAAGFKQATVNSGDVPATQTNFPVYVDLSRVGITTLAEAQSVRCYSDSSKTTELAREIVSVTQMHVKIPSLTNTFVLYVDYDGVRADYAVTDTFGRNAVWSDYAAAYHMEQDPSGSAPQIIDSTGNGNNGTSNGSMVSGDLLAAKVENGLDFDTTDDYISVPDSASLDITQGTVQAWAYAIENDADHEVVCKPQNATYTAPFFSYGLRLQMRTASNSDGPFFFINGGGTLRNASSAAQNLNLNQWYMLHGTYDGSNIRVYQDGSNVGTTAYSGSITTSIRTLQIGNRATGGQYSNQRVDEVRIRGTAVSADWITTEYNNQSDEAGFWGTWTDAGGGATPTPTLMMLGIGT